MIDTHCPHCGSTSTQRRSVVVDQGTRTTDSFGTSTSWGKRGGTRTHSSHSVSRSNFASRLALQSQGQLDFRAALFVFCIGASLIATFCYFDWIILHWPIAVVGLVAQFGLFAMLSAETPEERNERQRREAIYLKQWVCKKCGKLWIPQSIQAEATAATIPQAPHGEKKIQLVASRCPDCGARLNPETHKCEYCGTGTPQEHKKAAPHSTPQHKSPTRTSSGQPIIAWTAGCAVAIVGLLFYYSIRDAEKASELKAQAAEEKRKAAIDREKQEIVEKARREKEEVQSREQEKEKALESERSSRLALERTLAKNQEDLRRAAAKKEQQDRMEEAKRQDMRNEWARQVRKYEPAIEYVEQRDREQKLPVADDYAKLWKLQPIDRQKFLNTSLDANTTPPFWRESSRIVLSPRSFRLMHDVFARLPIKSETDKTEVCSSFDIAGTTLEKEEFIATLEPTKLLACRDCEYALICGLDQPQFGGDRGQVEICRLSDYDTNQGTFTLSTFWDDFQLHIGKKEAADIERSRLGEIHPKQGGQIGPALYIELTFKWKQSAGRSVDALFTGVRLTDRLNKKLWNFDVTEVRPDLPDIAFYNHSAESESQSQTKELQTKASEKYRVIKLKNGKTLEISSVLKADGKTIVKDKEGSRQTFDDADVESISDPPRN